MQITEHTPPLGFQTRTKSTVLRLDAPTALTILELLPEPVHHPKSTTRPSLHLSTGIPFDAAIVPAVPVVPSSLFGSTSPIQSRRRRGVGISRFPRTTSPLPLGPGPVPVTRPNQPCEPPRGLTFFCIAALHSYCSDVSVQRSNRLTIPHPGERRLFATSFGNPQSTAIPRVTAQRMTPGLRPDAAEGCRRQR